ncbi:uncharacterized protein LOC142632711 [Castanea sativa]|uniref:uncharacterized protein LOC142632711 n=1 Tax=Castanea sativa TaxID=21020 RepID=UPI003F64A950
MTFIDLLGTVFAENREPALFSMVVWALWTRWNHLRAGENTGTLDHLLQQARDRLRDFLHHNTARIQPVGHPPTSWQPPGPSQYKINVDGVLFMSNSSAGLGVVIRNEHGQVMVSLSKRTPLPSIVIEVEALAARRGLELAVEMGFKNIVLESDSQVLITALWDNSYSLASFGHMVKDIQFIAYQLSSISYTHVRRQCNTLTRSLARRAKSVSQFQVWIKEVPPNSSSILRADIFGLL